MRFHEEEYLTACQQILDYGAEVKDRTGVGTLMDTNVLIEHTDVEHYFPLPVTKKLATKAMIGELLWFLEGSTDDARLAAITYNDPKKDTIWTANYKAEYWQNRLEERWPGQKDSFMGHQTTYENDDVLHGALRSAPTRWLGAVYGAQWREGFGTDQIWNVIEGINKDPYGRRHVVSAWNPGHLKDMALPPCHMIFQFNVRGDRLDIAMFQRSGDMFLGVPFNIASYALLLKIVAKQTGYRAGKLSIFIGNAHIYLNHVDQVKEQLSRRRHKTFYNAMYDYQDNDTHPPCPQIVINTTSQLFNNMGDIGYKLSDFTVANYNPLPAIKGSMAV